VLAGNAPLSLLYIYYKGQKKKVRIYLVHIFLHSFQNLPSWYEACHLTWFIILSVSVISWMTSAVVDLLQVDLVLASGASLVWPRIGRPRAKKSREVCHMKSDEGLFWKSSAVVSSLGIIAVNIGTALVGIFCAFVDVYKTEYNKFTFFSIPLWIAWASESVCFFVEQARTSVEPSSHQTTLQKITFYLGKQKLFSIDFLQLFTPANVLGQKRSNSCHPCSAYWSLKILF